MSQVVEALQRVFTILKKVRRKKNKEYDKFQEESPINSVHCWLRFHRAVGKTKGDVKRRKEERSCCKLTVTPRNNTNNRSTNCPRAEKGREVSKRSAILTFRFIDLNRSYYGYR